MNKKPLNLFVRSVQNEVVIECRKNQYQKCLNEDLEFGERSEDNMKGVLEKHFQIDLQKTTKTHQFDFLSLYDKVWIELKTRKNKKSAYSTTMLPYSKVEYGLQQIKDGWSVYFVFAFEDCLCYYKLEAVNKDWVARGGRRDRGRPEFKQYYYIPITELQCIEPPPHTS